MADLPLSQSGLWLQESIVNAAASLEISAQNFRLLAGMTASQVAEIGDLACPVQFEPGEIIVVEGDPGDSLYLIACGSVEVTMKSESFQVAKLGPGDDFGGLSIFSETERAATVRALEPVSLYVLSADVLQDRLSREEETAASLLVRNQLRQHGDQIRKTSGELVDALKAQLEDANTRLEMGSVLAYVFCLMGLYGFALRGTISLVDHSTTALLSVTVGVTLLYGAMVYFLIDSSSFSRAEYGLTMKNWKPASIEALVWSLAFCAVITLLKWVLIHVLPQWEGEPLVELQGLDRSRVWYSVLIMGIYGISAPLQELSTRGALQSSLQRFLVGPFATARAIGIVTILFATTHLHISTTFAVASVVPSVFWGIMFARQKTLVGVSISHILIGWWCGYFLGLPDAF